MVGLHLDENGRKRGLEKRGMGFCSRDWSRVKRLEGVRSIGWSVFFC